MHYTTYDSEQHFFDNALAGLYVVARLIGKAVLYFPVLFTGYWLATAVLHKQDTAMLWITIALLFAYAVFCAVYCLKGILIACRNAGNLLWVPIFIGCIAFTCFAPGWLVFHSLEPILTRISPDHGTSATWVISIGSAIYLYSQYDFLADRAPALAWPGYWLGNRLIGAITHLQD